MAKVHVRNGSLSLPLLLVLLCRVLWLAFPRSHLEAFQLKHLVAASICSTTRFPYVSPPKLLPLVVVVLLSASVVICALSRRAHSFPNPEYVIQGLGHNVPFLRDVSRNKDFAAGDYSTSFIDKHYPDG